MPTHSTQITSVIGNDTVSMQESVTADQSIDMSIAVADSSTDLQSDVTIDISDLKSFFLSSNYAVTVETNSGSTPDDTFTLVANSPIAWTENSATSNPLTADVTALYFTNSSGSAATVRVRALLDSTP